MPRNLHKEITARVLAELKAGTVPWRRPWSQQTSGAMPRNAVTNRGYSGVNVILLWSESTKAGYDKPLWLTFKQALEKGGNVRKGEKGSHVVYVSHVERVDEKTGEKRRIPFLKDYTVFNVAQCDGLDLEALKPVKPRHSESRDPEIDAFLASTGAVIRHGEGRAYFQPAGDFVMLPNFAVFEGASAYYGTAFHELCHWTGHEKRLDRAFGKKFGDKAYSQEELVAELGSAFLSAEFGLDSPSLNGNSAAYIASWVSFLEDHETAIVSAAGHASKAVDYLRGLASAEAQEAA